MTSIVDCEAHLAKRATEVGLTDGALQSLVRSGLSTLGRLAFAHGQPSCILKRLLFEGHTMVLSQLREAVANPEAARTRKLPQVERNAKMVTLRAALPGVCAWFHSNSSPNSWRGGHGEDFKTDPIGH